MGTINLKELQALIATDRVQEVKDILDSMEPEETAEYWRLKGAVEQKYQNWGEAINAFNKVLELNPEDEEAKVNLHMIQNILNFWNPEMFNP